MAATTGGAPSGWAHLLLGGVDDAEARRRHGLQSGRTDRLPAHLADAVPTGAQPLQGGVDLVQRVPKLGGQPLRLAPLGRHLAGVGEVGVVAEARITLVGEPQFLQLRLELGLLGCGAGRRSRRPLIPR